MSRRDGVVGDYIIIQRLIFYLPPPPSGTHLLKLLPGRPRTLAQLSFCAVILNVVLPR